MACGLRVRTGTCFGVGVGPTFDVALDMAEFVAGVVGEPKAKAWYDLQRCIDPGCPTKTAMQYQAGNLVVDVKVNPISFLWIVAVHRTWTAWFYCIGEDHPDEEPLPEVPEEYHGGHRPKP